MVIKTDEGIIFYRADHAPALVIFVTRMPPRDLFA